MTVQTVTQTPGTTAVPIPDFISILRDIRDNLYPEMSIWHTDVQDMYEEIKNSIYPDITGKWVDITAIYNAMVVIHAEASTLLYTEPATASYDPLTGLMSFGIPQGTPGFGLIWEGEDTLAAIVAKTPAQQGECWQSTDAGTMPDGTTPVIINDIIVASGTTAADWFNVGQIRGPIGYTGPAGTPGANGEKWYVDIIDPNVGTGVDGDLALNVTSYDMFEKRVGAWVNIGNIKGVKGDTGATSGIWDNLKNYVAGEMTTEANAVYVAISDNTGVQPSTNDAIWKKDIISVDNSLSSTSTVNALSAAQGKALSDSKITTTNYAASTIGGTLKARLSGDILYLTNNGADA